MAAMTDPKQIESRSMSFEVYCQVCWAPPAAKTRRNSCTGRTGFHQGCNMVILVQMHLSKSNFLRKPLELHSGRCDLKKALGPGPVLPEPECELHKKDKAE